MIYRWMNDWKDIAYISPRVILGARSRFFLCHFVHSLCSPCIMAALFLSINTILGMQGYPVWVTEGYFHGCVTSLFVFTMLSKERSLFSKPLWHTNYCCVDVFSPTDSVAWSQTSNIIPIMSQRFASTKRWHLHLPASLLDLNTHTFTHKLRDLNTHTSV